MVILKANALSDSHWLAIQLALCTIPADSAQLSKCMTLLSFDTGVTGESLARDISAVACHEIRICGPPSSIQVFRRWPLPLPLQKKMIKAITRSPSIAAPIFAPTLALIERPLDASAGSEVAVGVEDELRVLEENDGMKVVTPALYFPANYG